MKLFNSILNYKVSPDWDLDLQRAYRQVNGFLAFMGSMAFLGIFIAYFSGLKISVFIQFIVAISYFFAFRFIRKYKLKSAKLFSIYTFEIAMFLNSLVVIFPTSSIIFPYISTVVFVFILYPIIAALLELSIKKHIIWGLLYFGMNLIILKLLPEQLLLSVHSDNMLFSQLALAVFLIILAGGLVLIIYNEQIFVKQKKIEYSIKLEKTLETLNNTLKKVEDQKLQIEKQSNELQILNDTKDRFFSIIAHDLRSPFNSLLGFIDLLKTEDYDEDDQKKIINILHESATTAYSLVNNLLDWSRSQFRQISFNPEKLNLKLKVDNCIRIVESLAWNKQIEIKNFVPNDVTIFADRDMIHSIFRNLLTNAIKFTENNGIILINASHGENYIEITVKDNGIGISKENLKKIFSNNNKSNIGTAKEKGTGLGLLLCHEFVKTHQGKIWVDSEMGSGSTFYIQLPKNSNNQTN